MVLSGVLITPGNPAEPPNLTSIITLVRDDDTIEVGEVPIRLKRQLEELENEVNHWRKQAPTGFLKHVGVGELDEPLSKYDANCMPQRKMRFL